MNRVVVVEDETMARKGIILTIDWSALGCVIVGEAANGEEGAALVERLSPDIVVTDVKMPRMDGVEMIAKLRENGCQAKFIILTAYSDFKYAQSALLSAETVKRRGTGGSSPPYSGTGRSAGDERGRGTGHASDPVEFGEKYEK
mgnify:CR=1 FL=1